MPCRTFDAPCDGLSRPLLLVLALSCVLATSACEEEPAGIAAPAPEKQASHRLPPPDSARDDGAPPLGVEDQRALAQARRGLRSDHHFRRGEALAHYHRRGWATRLGPRDVQLLRRIIEIDPERNRALALALLATHAFEDVFPQAADFVAKSRNPGLRTLLKNALRSQAASHQDYLRKASRRSYTPDVQALALQVLKDSARRRPPRKGRP